MALFGRRPPGLEPLHVGELQHHAALGRPGAFQHFRRPTARNIPATVGGNCGRHLLPVLLEQDGVQHLNVCDHIDGRLDSLALGERDPSRRCWHCRLGSRPGPSRQRPPSGVERWLKRHAVALQVQATNWYGTRGPRLAREGFPGRASRLHASLWLVVGQHMPPPWPAGDVSVIPGSEGLQVRLVESTRDDGDSGLVVDGPYGAAASAAKGPTGAGRRAPCGRLAARADPFHVPRGELDPGERESARMPPAAFA